MYKYFFFSLNERDFERLDIFFDSMHIIVASCLSEQKLFSFSFPKKKFNYNIFKQETKIKRKFQFEDYSRRFLYREKVSNQMPLINN